LRIRPAGAADLPAIARIHSDAWHWAYRGLVPDALLAQVTPASRLNVWQRWFDSGSHDLALLVEGRDVLGFIRTGPPQPVADPPPGYGELSHLYLEPAGIGTGLGHVLFEQARRHLADRGYGGMLLWTLAGNRRARRFYESHGMSGDGARKEEPDWHGPGVFEVRYRLPFDGAAAP